MAIQSFFDALSKGFVCFASLNMSLSFFFGSIWGEKNEQVIKGSVLTPSLFVTLSQEQPLSDTFLQKSIKLPMHGPREDRIIIGVRRRSQWIESRGEPSAEKNGSDRSWMCPSPSRTLPPCEAGAPNPNPPSHWREPLPCLDPV